MRRVVLIVGFFILSQQANASPIPDEIIKKEYETCLNGMGQPDPSELESKKAYCACTSNGLNSIMDFEGFKRFSQETAAGHPPQNEMGKLQALASNCIAKTLK